MKASDDQGEMLNGYYVLFDTDPETPVGPLDFVQLRQLAEERRVHAETLVACGGESVWLPLGRRAELAGITDLLHRSPLNLGATEFDRVNERDLPVENRVEDWLGVNRRAAQLGGADDFTEADLALIARQRRGSRRMSDYLKVLGGVGVLMGWVLFFGPLAGISWASVVALPALVVAGLTWVFFFVLEPY